SRPLIAAPPGPPLATGTCDRCPSFVSIRAPYRRPHLPIRIGGGAVRFDTATSASEPKAASRGHYAGAQPVTSLQARPGFGQIPFSGNLQIDLQIDFIAANKPSCAR